jgi:hypothetical protein
MASVNMYFIWDFSHNQNLTSDFYFLHFKDKSTVGNKIV